MSSCLTELLESSSRVWRGSHVRQAPSGVKTGFAELDAALPACGWPAASVMELVADQEGIGELRLLLPAMSALSRQGQWVVLIAPPYIPYAPALMTGGAELSHLTVIEIERPVDAPWAMEKVLRSPACGMALAWSNRSGRHFNAQTIRRLQLAAEAGGGMGVLFRKQAPASSPAVLRIRLAAEGDRLRVQVLKARGTHTRPIVDLSV